MTELTAKKYLESKGLNDHDYQDSGMINHISEMMEEYHQTKLHLLTIPVVVKSFYCLDKNWANAKEDYDFKQCDKQCDECKAI